MKLRGWQIVAVYVAAVAVLAAGIVRFVAARDDERPRTAPPAAAELVSMPFATALTSTGADRGRVGSPIELQVAAFTTQPITEVIVRDGALAVGRSTPAAGTSSLTVSAPALSVGPHILHAEVHTVDGATAATSPVTITVHAGPGGDPLPVEVTAFPGESTTDVAERLGLPSDTIAATDPADPYAAAPAPADPLPPDATVTAFVAPDRGLDTLAGAKPIVVSPKPFGDVTPAPAVQVDDDCRVRLTGSRPMVEQSAGIAGWRGLSGTSVVLTPGVHVFRSLDQDDLSAPVEVTAPSSCGKTVGWTGDVSIVDGILNTTYTGYGFLLLGQEDETWTRIPAEQGQSMAIRPGQSIAHLLPALGGRSLDVQLWVMPGDIPQQKGAGHLEIGTDVDLADVVGQPQALTLAVADPELLASDSFRFDGYPLSFRWHAASSGTDTVRWQVTTAPAPSAAGDPNPPGLLATGSATGAPDAAGGNSGTFDIDFRSIPTTEATSAVTAASGQKYALAASPLVDTASLAAKKPAFATTAIAPGAVQVIDLPDPGEPVYVRIIAEPSTTGATAASPSLTIALPRHEQAGDAIRMLVDEMTLTAGRAPNPALAGCVVVDVPWPEPTAGYTAGKASWPPAVTPTPFDQALAATGSPFAAGVLSHFYPKDGTYCPGDWPPPTRCDGFLCDLYYGVVDGITALVELAKQYWDLATTVYNSIVDGVVGTIASLNVGCEIFGAAGGDADDCYQASRIVAGVAVSAALSSVGLPPRLPGSDAIVGVTRGEVGGLVTEALGAIGVPCDTLATDPDAVAAIASLAKKLGVSETEVAAQIAADPCGALAGLLFDNAVGAARTQASGSVAASTGMPFDPSIKGLTLTPAPQSLPQPARVSVTLRPFSPEADLSGFTCQIRVHAPGKTNHSPSPYRTATFSVGSGLHADTQIDPNGADANLVQKLSTLGTLAVELSPYAPTGCRFEPQIISSTLAPPLPRPKN